MGCADSCLLACRRLLCLAHPETPFVMRTRASSGLEYFSHTSFRSSVIISGCTTPSHYSLLSSVITRLSTLVGYIGLDLPLPDVLLRFLKTADHHTCPPNYGQHKCQIRISSWAFRPSKTQRQGRLTNHVRF